MRVVLQRVSAASVDVEGNRVGEIGRGLLILVGVGHDDELADAQVLARKCWQLRIFEDEQGKMNRSLEEIGGSALVVSQFTLYADTRKGRRPSWGQAAEPAKAAALYEAFVSALMELGCPVATGVFQATMKVSLVNEGPVTIILDSDKS